jgi:hypothetical protein
VCVCVCVCVSLSVMNCNYNNLCLKRVERKRSEEERKIERKLSNLFRFAYIKGQKGILLHCDYSTYVAVTVSEAFTKAFLL